MSLTTDSFGPHQAPDPARVLAQVATAVHTTPGLADHIALHSERLFAYIADRIDDFDLLAGRGADAFRLVRLTACHSCQRGADEHLDPAVLIACADAAVLSYPLLWISIPPAVASYLDDLVDAISAYEREAGI